jgi:hypothetical protein
MLAASAPNAMAIKQTLFSAALLTCVLSPHSHAQTVKEKLFANPTNIEINLAYLQEQLAKRNFKGAAATLQRVLLLDPESKLEKYFMQRFSCALVTLLTLASFYVNY